MTINKVQYWLTKNKRSLRWLALEAGVKYSSLYANMQGLYNFSDDTIARLKKVIK